MAADIATSQNTPEPEIEVSHISPKEHGLDREQVFTPPSPSLAPPTPAQRPRPQISRSPSLHNRPKTPDPPPDSTKATQGSRSRTKQKCYSRKPVSERPLKSLYADLTSKGKILAPNSDTSGTGSSQMRSQSLPVLSQSQSMGGSQGPLRYSQSLSYVTASVRESQEEGKMVGISQERSQGRSQSQKGSQLKNEVLGTMEVDADVTEDHSPADEMVQEKSLASEPKEPGDAPPPLGASVQVSEEKAPQDVVMQTNSNSSPSKSAPAAENSETESETEEEGDVYDQLSEGEFEVKPEEEEEVIMLQAEEEEEESQNIDMLKEEEEESQQRVENLAEGPKPQSPMRENVPDPAVIKSPEIPLPTPRPQTVSQSSSSRARPRAARKAPANFHGSPARPKRPSGPDVFVHDVSSRPSSPKRSSPPPSASVRPPKVITDEVARPAVPPLVTGSAPPNDVVSEAPPSTHDIVAWGNPSFLRNREEQRNQQEKVAPTKKRAHPPSDSSDEEPPTPKRRKVASRPASRRSVSRESHPSATLPKPPEPDSSVQEKPAASVQRNDSLASTTSRIRKIDLRRSGSVSSTSSLKRTESKWATALAYKPIPSKSMKTSKESDSAATEQPQTAVAPSKQATTKPQGSQSPEPPRLHSSVKGKGRAEPMIPVSKPTVAARPSFQFLPGAAALKTSPRSAGPQGAVSSRKPSVSKTSKASASPKTRKEEVRKPPTPTPTTAPDARSIYRIETTVRQENGSPPVTWSVLDGILLRVGRARFKEEKKKKGAGA